MRGEIPLGNFGSQVFMNITACFEGLGLDAAVITGTRT